VVVIHNHLENVQQAKVLEKQVEIIVLTTRQLHDELRSSPVSRPQYAEAAGSAVKEVYRALQVGARACRSAVHLTGCAWPAFAVAAGICCKVGAGIT
jgi:hypothetical protein